MPFIVHRRQKWKSTFWYFSLFPTEISETWEHSEHTNAVIIKHCFSPLSARKHHFWAKDGEKRVKNVTKMSQKRKNHIQNEKDVNKSLTITPWVWNNSKHYTNHAVCRKRNWHYIILYEGRALKTRTLNRIVRQQRGWKSQANRILATGGNDKNHSLTIVKL